jgi:hypothetical protein
VNADDPLTAFDDAIRENSPDHLLIGLRREDHANWQERGLVDALLARFAIPITVFQLPRGRRQSAGARMMSTGRSA